MSTVRLTGTTSGYVELTAPAVAGNNTVALPSSNGAANQLLKNGATTGSLEFASNVVIDSSGRMLVGSASASGPASLQVTLDGANTEVFKFSGSGAAKGFAVQLNDASASQSRFGYFDVKNESGATVASVTSNVNTDGSSDLLFYNQALGTRTDRRVERFALTREGWVFLHRGANIAGGTSFFDDGYTPVYRNATDGGFGIVDYYSNWGATRRNVCRIRSDGNILNYNNSYGSLSDIKLKENIIDAGSQWDDVKSLQVKNFNFIGDGRRQIGLVAQQVEEVCPGLVDESRDISEQGEDLGTVTKSVKYSVLYMKAIKALQEAMERIETLESRLAALEANQ